MRNKISAVAAIGVLLLALLAAGCGGGSSVQRVPGLNADAVVQTFFEAAKNGQYNEAGLYVESSSANDPKSVLKYLAGKTDLEQLKTAKLVSLKKVAEEGNYSVVVATLQNKENSLDIAVKPVGLEKINGEWYIISLDKIYQDAKYMLLQQLLASISSK